MELLWIWILLLFNGHWTIAQEKGCRECVVFNIPHILCAPDVSKVSVTPYYEYATEPRFKNLISKESIIPIDQLVGKRGEVECCTPKPNEEPNRPTEVNPALILPQTANPDRIDQKGNNLQVVQENVVVVKENSAPVTTEELSVSTVQTSPKSVKNAEVSSSPLNRPPHVESNCDAPKPPPCQEPPLVTCIPGCPPQNALTSTFYSDCGYYPPLCVNPRYLSHISSAYNRPSKVTPVNSSPQNGRSKSPDQVLVPIITESNSGPSPIYVDRNYMSKICDTYSHPHGTEHRQSHQHPYGYQYNNNYQQQRTQHNQHIHNNQHSSDDYQHKDHHNNDQQSYRNQHGYNQHTHNNQHNHNQYQHQDQHNHDQESHQKPHEYNQHSHKDQHIHNPIQHHNQNQHGYNQHTHNNQHNHNQYQHQDHHNHYQESHQKPHEYNQHSHKDQHIHNQDQRHNQNQHGYNQHTPSDQNHPENHYGHNQHNHNNQNTPNQYQHNHNQQSHQKPHEYSQPPNKNQYSQNQYSHETPHNYNQNTHNEQHNPKQVHKEKNTQKNQNDHNQHPTIQSHTESANKGKDIHKQQSENDNIHDKSLNSFDKSKIQTQQESPKYSPVELLTKSKEVKTPEVTQDESESEFFVDDHVVDMRKYLVDTEALGYDVPKSEALDKGIISSGSSVSQPPQVENVKPAAVASEKSETSPLVKTIPENQESGYTKDVRW